MQICFAPSKKTRWIHFWLSFIVISEWASKMMSAIDDHSRITITVCISERQAFELFSSWNITEGNYLTLYVKYSKIKIKHETCCSHNSYTHIKWLLLIKTKTLRYMFINCFFRTNTCIWIVHVCKWFIGLEIYNFLFFQGIVEES